MWFGRGIIVSKQLVQSIFGTDLYPDGGSSVLANSVAYTKHNYQKLRSHVAIASGPPWMPVLGSALHVHRLRKKTGYLYQATAELAKCYGPVVGLRIGKDRQVVLCGYEAIRDMLSRDEFDGRPQGIFYETRTWGKRRGE